MKLHKKTVYVPFFRPNGSADLERLILKEKLSHGTRLDWCVHPGTSVIFTLYGFSVQQMQELSLELEQDLQVIAQEPYHPDADVRIVEPYSFSEHAARMVRHYTYLQGKLIGNCASLIKGYVVTDYETNPEGTLHCSDSKTHYALQEMIFEKRKLNIKREYTSV